MNSTLLDRDALYTEVLANPTDDGLRRILADWYEENGDPVRAEFIRLQLEIVRLDMGVGQLPMGVNREKLLTRQRQILLCYAGKWFDIPIGKVVCWLRDEPGFSVYMDGSRSSVVDVLFKRGFPSWVECTQTIWLEYGKKLVKMWPLETVSLQYTMPLRRSGEYVWLCAGNTQYGGVYKIAQRLFDKIPHPDGTKGSKGYNTKEDAVYYLSQGCLIWAREKE